MLPVMPTIFYFFQFLMFLLWVFCCIFYFSIFLFFYFSIFLFFYFFIFLFFINFLLIYLNEIFYSYIYLNLLLLMIGFIILLSIICEAYYIKTFLATSSIINTLFIFLTLSSTNINDFYFYF